MEISFFFKKNIKIINLSDAAKTFTSGPFSQNFKPELQFFPEGGSLVDSVSSIVAFKASDARGMGCNVSGEIYSSSGELVTTFRSTKMGFGSFSLTPDHDIDYFAVVKDLKGDTVRRRLPKSFFEGIVLSAYRNSDKKLVVTLKTNNATFPTLSAKDLLLTVSRHNEVFKTINIHIEALSSFFVLPVRDLPDGIFMLTLSIPDDRFLCERLVYVNNSGDTKINLETHKAVYGQRDSVSVKIALTGNTEVIPETYLSFSAARNINQISSSTISSWFLLESDIRGPVEEPSGYFDPSNPNRLKDLDLLLLTQGWRDFKWKYKKTVFPPEYGFNISGKVRKLFADDPLPGIKVNIAIFKSGSTIIKTIPTDSSGKFQLNDIDFNGDARLIISSSNGKENLKGWVLLDSTKYFPASVPDNNKFNIPGPDEIKSIKQNEASPDSLIINTDVRNYIQYAEIRSSIQKKYRLSDTINPGEVTITAKRQDKPESPRALNHRYLMALNPDYEYTVAPESEIFNTLGRLIAFRLHMGSGFWSGLRLINPLVLLNGMDVGWEGIMDLPIEWIERFDVLFPNSPAAMVWGERGKGGVISVLTRTGAPSANKNIVYHSVNVKFSGYNEPRVFSHRYTTHHLNLIINPICEPLFSGNQILNWKITMSFL